MRAALLTLNVLLLIFMLLNVENWYAANSHLPLLEWSMFLPSPIPFFLLLLSLPFMPYRGTKQLWLVGQAFLVGLPLAFSWLAHMNEPLSNTAGAVSFSLALALLAFNLRTIQRSKGATGSALLIPYAPAAVAVILAVLVAHNDALRPIEGQALNELFQTYQRTPPDVPETARIAAQIRTTVVAGMISKGYSREYSEAIARDTHIQYLVPLATDWKLVRD